MDSSLRTFRINRQALFPRVVEGALPHRDEEYVSECLCPSTGCPPLLFLFISSPHHLHHRHLSSYSGPIRPLACSSSLSPNYRISRFRLPFLCTHSYGSRGHWMLQSIDLACNLASSSRLLLFLIPSISSGKFSNSIFSYDYNYRILSNSKYGEQLDIIHLSWTKFLFFFSLKICFL